MNSVRKCAVMVMLLATTTIAHAAGLYKWTDDKGQVHYTQLPPTARPAKELTPERSPVTEPPQTTAKEQAEQTEQAQAASDAEPTALPKGMTQDAQAEDAKSQRKRKNCESARANLAIVETSKKIIGPDGTLVRLSPEMREAKVKESMEQIRLYCE